MISDRGPSRYRLEDAFADASKDFRAASEASAQGVTVMVPFIPCPAWPSTGQMNVYVPAASVAAIVSLVPGPKARSFVARLTPLPLMTSAWLIVPSLRASNVTGVPALIITVAGLIEYSLSESVIVDPETGLLVAEFERVVFVEALGGGAKVKPGVDPPAPQPATIAAPATTVARRTNRPGRIEPRGDDDVTGRRDRSERPKAG
jgi:hypothetical protein